MKSSTRERLTVSSIGDSTKGIILKRPLCFTILLMPFEAMMQLREIEAHRYDAKQFMGELKQMVADIVHQVLSDNTPRRIS